MIYFISVQRFATEARSMSSVLNGYIPDTFTAIFSLPLIDRGENKIQSTSIRDKNENYHDLQSQICI